MDAVELRRQYGHAIGFCGSSDMQVWETNDFITALRSSGKQGALSHEKRKCLSLK